MAELYTWQKSGGGFTSKDSLNNHSFFQIYYVITTS